MLVPIVVGTWTACSGPDTDSPVAPQPTATPFAGVIFAEQPTNVLILFLDDLGVDQVAAYAAHPEPPATPTLDTLATRGVRFDRAYSTPVCSPARAALLTGRTGRRTGIGDIVPPPSFYELPEREVLLPEAPRLADTTWRTAAIGKWHLAGTDAGDDWATHAQRQGFDTHIGSPGNLNEAYGDARGLGYFHWERLEDGVLSIDERYATTAAVDDTLAWVATADEPWLTHIGFHAAHAPFHAPPPTLLGGADLTDASPADRYAGMVTALDAEIGRLLDELDPDVLSRTLIVAMGDNGTPGAVVRPPWDPDQAKGTLFEGGIHVPLIVAGAGVSAEGTTSEALVHVVDVFSTVLDIAGVDPGALQHDDGSPVVLDGRSLLPLLADPDGAGFRDILVTEMFSRFGGPPHSAEGFAVRDDRYKLYELRLPAQPVDTRLFDLQGRVDDGPNLLDGPLDPQAEAALTRLQDALAAHEAVPFDGGP